MAMVSAWLVGLSGCTAIKDALKTDRYRFFSPDQIVRPPAESMSINPIFPSVGPADAAQELVPNATFPREGDWEYTDEDYILGPTDVLSVTILDLYQEGMETTLQVQVSDSGYIDLPMVDEPIKAEGLTKDQLRKSIVGAYSPDILKEPIITVTITSPRQNTFSILGSVARPSQYAIVRKDMRLLTAVAIAGGVTERNIRWIYVVRPAPAVRRPVAAAAKPMPPAVAPGGPPELPPTAPAETEPSAETGPAAVLTHPAEKPGVPAEKIDIDKALRELKLLDLGDQGAKEPTTLPAPSAMLQLTETASLPAQQAASQDVDHKEEMEKAESAKTYKWVYTEGQWIRVAQEAPVASKPSGAGAPRVRPAEEAEGIVKAEAPKPPAVEEAADPFGWRKLDKSGQARIIAVDLAKLESGDPRMNVVIRNDDIIQVPSLTIAEFYVMGEVARPGAYALTGRRINIKHAIAAAGNFAALAWPQNAVLYRRVGENEEQVIPLDLEAIFRGEQPDYFMKADDVLAVGTDVRTMFYAVMRNAFRATYGFGFIYDRNFADPLVGHLDSRRFQRW